MKFLISNYSTHWFTEPLYFNAALNLLNEKCKSVLYDTNKSLYDNFDLVQPDYFIVNYSSLKEDLIQYLSENNNIKLLVNVSNVESELIKALQSKIDNLNIQLTFFGTQDLKLENTKFIKILEAADVFIPEIPKQYDIDKLIFVNNTDQIKELEGTYHYTSTNPDLNNQVDFVGGIGDFVRLFSNYKEIIFKDEAYIGSQILFNAIYSKTKVILDCNNNSNVDKIHSIFKGDKLYSATKNNHTCLHRLKTLLNSVGLNYSKEIDTILEKI